MTVLDTIGRSLADGAGMFWETLWALVLGFSLSGVVQSFVSRAEMRRALGNRRPQTIAKASVFGMASSSCSYAASALAKTLFQRGADFTAAQSFMFASTNLVLELGIVLWLLLGWEFAAAEFVGGFLMIAMLAVVLPRVVDDRAQTQARAALSDAHDRHEGHAGPDHDDEAPHAEGSWRSRLTSTAGWADAAGYTVSDLTMLRKELFAGFVIAGFADAAVPTSFWSSLFLTGHGFWSTLENVVLGPFLAIISFVCSVGNVPLAAALWTGGISFGGTVAFVFADLIAIPLLLIYRKYYGTRLTVKLLAVFWSTMSVAGLVTEYIFKAAGIAPGAATSRHGMVGRDVWGWNYTSVLDVIALIAFAGIYWLYRNRARFGAGLDYAKDPVCGMQVERAHPGATARHHGEVVYFCSDHCRDRFESAPARYVEAHPAAAASMSTAGLVVDPVCGMSVDPATAAARVRRDGVDYFFCNSGCAQRFSVGAAPPTGG